MKNNNIKIILSAIILLAVVGFVGIAEASSASLYLSPSSLTKTAGDTFDVSIGVNPSGNNVCVVEGTLVFNNLSCQSITIVEGVMAQSSPTCSNLRFLIGIPGCATSDMPLLTVSVKAENAGTASINLTRVDVIGEGVSIGSASISKNYTINAIPKPTLKPIPKPVPKHTPIPEITVPIQILEIAPLDEPLFDVSIQPTEPIKEESKKFNRNIIYIAGIILLMFLSYYLGGRKIKKTIK